MRSFFQNFELTGGAAGFHGMAGTTPLVIWLYAGAAFIFVLASDVRDQLAATLPYGLQRCVENLPSTRADDDHTEKQSLFEVPCRRWV